jgi:hypothetical protein
MSIIRVDQIYPVTKYSSVGPGRRGLHDRPAAGRMMAWVRTRPGTGRLFRASWDPILIAARGVPKAVDRAAIRNVVITAGDFGGADLGMEEFSGEDVPAVIEADYERPRRHPYSKPPAVYDTS